MPSLSIPYTIMTSREPPFFSDVLALAEGDLGLGFVLDRGVPGGANFLPPAFSYTYRVQVSPDGQNWRDANGGTNFGGIIENGSGTAEDPMVIFQYDLTTGTIADIQTTKFLRAWISVEGLTSSEQFAFSGILASGPEENFQFGFPG